MGFWDRIEDFAGGAMKAAQAPFGLALDLGTSVLQGPGEHGNFIASTYFSLVNRGSQMAEGLISGDQGIGALVGGLPQGVRAPARNVLNPTFETMDAIYREGVGEPLSTLMTMGSLASREPGLGDLSVFLDRDSWRVAYDIAQDRSPGQAIALAIGTQDILDPKEVANFQETDWYQVVSGFSDFMMRMTLDVDVLAGSALAYRRGYMFPEVNPKVYVDAILKQETDKLGRLESDFATLQAQGATNPGTASTLQELGAEVAAQRKLVDELYDKAPQPGIERFFRSKSGRQRVMQSPVFQAIDNWINSLHRDIGTPFPFIDEGPTYAQLQRRYHDLSDQWARLADDPNVSRADLEAFEAEMDIAKRNMERARPMNEAEQLWYGAGADQDVELYGELSDMVDDLNMTMPNGDPIGLEDVTSPENLAEFQRLFGTNQEWFMNLLESAVHNSTGGTFVDFLKSKGYRAPSDVPPGLLEDELLRLSDVKTSQVLSRTSLGYYDLKRVSADDAPEFLKGAGDPDAVNRLRNLETEAEYSQKTIEDMDKAIDAPDLAAHYRGLINELDDVEVREMFYAEGKDALMALPDDEFIRIVSGGNDELAEVGHIAELKMRAEGELEEGARMREEVLSTTTGGLAAHGVTMNMPGRGQMTMYFSRDGRTAYVRGGNSIDAADIASQLGAEEVYTFGTGRIAQDPLATMRPGRGRLLVRSEEHLPGTTAQVAERIRDRLFHNQTHGDKFAYLLAGATDSVERELIMRVLMGDNKAIARLKHIRSGLGHELEQVFRQEGVVRDMTLYGDDAHRAPDWLMMEEMAYTDSRVGLAQDEVDDLINAHSLYDTALEYAGDMREMPRLTAGGALRERVVRSTFWQESAVAKPLKLFTNMRAHGMIDTTDPNATIHYKRMLEASRVWTKEEMDVMVGRFAARGTQERVATLLDDQWQTIARLAERAGLDSADIEVLRKAADKGTRAAIDKIRRRAVFNEQTRLFDLTDEIDGEVAVYQGIGADMHSVVPVVDFTMARRHFSRIGELRERFRGTAWEIPKELIDQANKLWKTSVLLRPAWTIRVVADEQLRILAKMGTMMERLPKSPERMRWRRYWGSVAHEWGFADPSRARKFGAGFGAVTGFAAAGPIGAAVGGGLGALVMKRLDDFGEGGYPQFTINGHRVAAHFGNTINTRKQMEARVSSYAELRQFMGDTERRNLGSLQVDLSTYQSYKHDMEGYYDVWARSLNEDVLNHPVVDLLIKNQFDIDKVSDILQRTPHGREIMRDYEMFRYEPRPWVQAINAEFHAATMGMDPRLMSRLQRLRLEGPDTSLGGRNQILQEAEDAERAFDVAKKAEQDFLENATFSVHADASHYGTDVDNPGVDIESFTMAEWPDVQMQVYEALEARRLMEWHLRTEEGWANPNLHETVAALREAMVEWLQLERPPVDGSFGFGAARVNMHDKHRDAHKSLVKNVKDTARTAENARKKANTIVTEIDAKWLRDTFSPEATAKLNPDARRRVNEINEELEGLGTQQAEELADTTDEAFKAWMLGDEGRHAMDFVDQQVQGRYDAYFSDPDLDDPDIEVLEPLVPRSDEELAAMDPAEFREYISMALDDDPAPVLNSLGMPPHMAEGEWSLNQRYRELFERLQMEKERILSDFGGRTPGETPLPTVNGPATKHQIGKGDIWARMRGFSDKMFKTLGTFATDELSRNPFFANMYEAEMMRQLRRFGPGDTVTISKAEMARMEKNARDFALNQVRHYLYDLAESSEFASMVRVIMPFYPAWQEVITRWAGLAVENPVFAARLHHVWEGSKNIPAIYTRDETTGDEYLQFRIPEVFKGLLSRSPLFGDALKSQGSIAFNRRSFNMITQGWPGFGPFVQVPVSELVKSRPELQESVNFILPYGPSNIVDTFLPAAGRRAKSQLTEDRAYASTYNRVLMTRIAEIQNYEDPKWQPADMNDPEVIDELIQEVEDETKAFFNLRTVANLVLPAAPTFHTPYKHYIDAWHVLQEEGNIVRNGLRVTPEERFIEEYGKEFFVFTQAMTRTNNGVPPTLTGIAMESEYGQLIQKYPELGGVIVGLDGGGGLVQDFVRSKYEAQLNTPLEPGSSEMQRDVVSPREFVTDPLARLGWHDYSKAMDALEALRIELGLPSMSVAGAEPLREAKQAILQGLARKYPSWWEEFNVKDELRWDKKIKGFKEMTNTPGLKDRPDLVTLGTYLKVRDVMLALLEVRKAQGGSGTMLSASNRDIAQAWDLAISTLVEQDLQFADLYYRYLDNDPVAPPRLGVVVYDEPMAETVETIA